MDDLIRRIAALSPQKRALLERHLQQQRRPSDGALILPRDGDGPVVLSSAQQRLWFIDQLKAGSAIYNIALARRLRGPLDEEALQQAFNALIERHEILRTTFEATPEGPVQHVQAPRSVPFERHELLHMLEADRFEAGLNLLRQAAMRPFDLTKDLMVRACMVRLADDERLLGITAHHVASDGWSNDILLRELVALYAARVSGEASSLSPLPIQYADYAIWQRKQLDSPEMAEELAYWQRQLQGLPPVELPPDRPRPPEQSYRGAVFHFMFPEPLATQLQDFARHEKVTLFMVLLAGFNALMQRYTLQEDIAVGTPIAGRVHAVVEPLIGCFVNTLVLRTDLSGAPSFRQLVQRVRDRALEAYEHQHAPFDQVVEVLQANRDLSRAPLFQTLFALQNVPRRSMDMPGIEVEEVPFSSEAAKFDTMWQLWEGEAGLIGRVTYSVDLYESSTLERMVGHYQRLLEAALAEPDQPLVCLSLLTQAERSMVVAAGAARRTVLPPPQSLHRLFEEQAARTPEAVALEHSDSVWSYADLNRSSNQLANLLRARGAGPGTLVALVLERSAWQVISILAVLKAGAAFVPLDASAPPERLGRMIEDAGPVRVLTQAWLAEVLPPSASPIETLESIVPMLPMQPETAPSEAGRPGDLAYVIYTSGSTGRPKGVMITHEAVGRLMQWVQAAYPLDAEDAGLMSTPLVFDVALCELFAPLIAGARVVIPPAGAEKDAAYLASLIAARGVTTLHAVPTLLRMLVEQDAFAQCQGLRRIIAAGEVLAVGLARRIRSSLGAALYNWYGPTEATIYATHHVCGEVHSRASIPIGRPLDTVRAYVLDSHLNPVPVGMPGELYLGGVQVAVGYLHQPERTAEHFIPDPFSEEPGARLYKTGDLVRWLPEGELQYMGRLDRQVKLRGYRIEPGEIESVLNGHALVSEAAVQVWTVAPGDERLVAYLVLSPEAGSNEGSTERNLRAYLRTRLPEYMVPSSLMVLSQLPVLASGKLDRARLPAPDFHAASDAPLPPQGETEETLAAIWQAVLKVEQVHREDDFFDLGGHSLLATQVAARIAEQFGVRLSLASFFKASTLAELAAVIIEYQAAVAASDDIAGLLDSIDSLFTD